MTYQYHCDKCNKPQEVIKPKSEADEKEHCLCGWELTKVSSYLSDLHGANK